MNHLNERYKHHCFLIMVTIDTAPGSVTYTENREHALACMEQAIHEKIRKVDISTRYSSMQYLLILYEPDETQIPKVMDRTNIAQSCIQMIESFPYSCYYIILGLITKRMKLYE